MVAANRDNTDGQALRTAIAASTDAAPDAIVDEPQASAGLHAFLGGSGSKVVLAQLDDLAGEHVPVNMPGTTTEHPNWRRRLSRSVQDIFASDQAERAIDAVSRGRIRQDRDNGTGA